MRILGYIDHPVWKITVFKTDTRLSIKVENGTIEQTYKFRPADHVNSLLEIRQLVDQSFLANIGQRFQEMEKDLAATFARNLPEAEEDDFPEIV